MSSSSSFATYLKQIRSNLNESMVAMDDPPSPHAMTYPIRPHVELPQFGSVSKNVITRKQNNKKKDSTTSENEKCFIETSKNSIRISFLFKQQHSNSDPIDQSILLPRRSQKQQQQQQQLTGSWILPGRPIRSAVIQRL